jgi:hypothetical protein
MTRSTNEQLEARVEEAANLLSEGWPGRRIVKELADKHGVSPQQARTYVSRGRQLLVEAVAPQDRAFMFAQVLAGLQQDRLDAKEAGNISAQVGASKAMVNHLKQIAHIDPMRDWEQALVEAAASTSYGNIPRVRVNKHGQELAVQQAFDNLGKTKNRITGQLEDNQFIEGFHD